MPQTLQNAKTRRAAAALLGAAAGIAVFLLVFGTAPLALSFDGWILNGYDEADVQQHYAGWLLFRNSRWAFPLGLCGTLAWPDGTVIAYTDSVPWVSIGLKLLRGILPGTFQWFGWYVLACFALQGAAGGLLTARVGCLPFAALGAGLFCMMPALWERAFRHVALTSHYLILFALYTLLEYRAALRTAGAGAAPPRYPWQFALLGFAAIGIHPYFLPPVLLCALLGAVDCARYARRPARGALGLAASLAATLAGGFLSGVLGGGVTASRYGYGDFSMNLNAPFNPSSRGGYAWSRLLPVLPQQPAQYDGFNYLGLGLLALLALALAASAVGLLSPAGRRRAGDWWRRNGFLTGGCALLTLFAVSNKVYWGAAGFTVPLPDAVLQFCGVFRASGRMFWLPACCAVLYSLYALWRFCAAKPRAAVWACAVLCAGLVLQGWDLSAAAAQKRAKFSAPVDATVVTDAQTADLGAGHRYLLAASALREDRVRLLAILAGKNGLATNLSIAVSGRYPNAGRSMADAAALLETGRYDPQAVYVTTDGGQYERWQRLFAEDPQVRLFVASSCYFLVPAG